MSLVINHNKEFIRMFAYGTLKRGFPNYKRFQLDRYSNFIWEDSVRGEMFNLMNLYPVLYDGDLLIEGEVLDVSLDIYSYISQMERDAGYSVGEIATAKGLICVAFFGDEATKDQYFCNATPITNWVEIPLPTSKKQVRRASGKHETHGACAEQLALHGAETKCCECIGHNCSKG